MKKLSLLYAIMAVILLSAFTVSATITTVDTFSGINPTFGSDSQEASNPRHDEVAQRLKTDDASINLRSDVDVTITGIQIELLQQVLQRLLILELVFQKSLTLLMPMANLLLSQLQQLNYSMV